MNNQEIKVTVAQVVRMLESIQLLDMNGHVSYRVPGTDHFYINSRKASRASVSVKDIVLSDLDGNLIEGENEPPSEKYIHGEIYKARPDVHAVVHGHPHWQTVLGIADIPMHPVFGIGSFVEDIPMYEESSLVNTQEMGEELAKTLGDKDILQIRHHGNVVVGEDIKSAFARTVYVEENAKKQFFAHLANKDMKVLKGENLKRTQETNWAPSIIQKAWDYHIEKSRKQGMLDNI